MYNEMVMESAAMERLITYLGQTPEGEIADTTKLEELLSGCWKEFAGDDGGMEPYKLLDRMQDVQWGDPILKFTIERHRGAVIGGSTRAELQHWTVDVERKTVRAYKWGHRQIGPRAAALDVEPIAEEIVQLVLNRAKDDRLKWSQKGNVRVLVGKILPEFSAVKQTLLGRRRRLRRAIKVNLTAHGWRQISNDWYMAPDCAG
jgi:hypothetical protein